MNLLLGYITPHMTSPCVLSVCDAVVYVSVRPPGHGRDGRGVQEGPVPGDPAGLPRAAGQREADPHKDAGEAAAKAGRQRFPLLLRGEAAFCWGIQMCSLPAGIFNPSGAILQLDIWKNLPL